MKLSPLKFARSFEQLKTQLRALPAADLRLMVLVDFWPALSELWDDRTYRSYFEEYTQLLLDHVTSGNLQDLLPPELKRLAEVTVALVHAETDEEKVGRIRERSELVATETARKLFYVGAVESGIETLAWVNRQDPPAIKLDDSVEPLSEIKALKTTRQQLTESLSPLKPTVHQILSAMEIEREALSFEEANCLFVEKNGHGDQPRGRLRRLQGSAEYRRRGAKTDEVTFENQIKAPDDPFVGAVYDALAAVGALCRESGISSPSGGHIRARFGIAGGDHTFTGDSIGLAAALVVYTQLLQPELLRHERFIACGAAFTGGVDAAGRLQPVNENTLRAKVERAFFSAVNYLVLPRANLEDAGKCVAELNRTYPRRRLLLTGANVLNDVIENRNIVRAERVCIGQFVARRTLKYSRAIKIQVPILLALLYFLVSLLFPKAWIGFDWEPHHVWLNDRHDQVLVYNRDTALLWSAETDCAPLDLLYAATHDLDADGRREVLYMQRSSEGIPCSTTAMLTVRDDDGSLRFTRACNIIGEYPGDTTASQHYEPRFVSILQTESGPIIVTDVVQSHPGRSHMKIWSADGQLLGWYVHAGHTRLIMAEDVNNDGAKEIMCLGINNPMSGWGLYVLPMRSCFGVSPPYEDPVYDLSSVKPGNQLHYVFFPTSDVTRADSLPYGAQGRIALLSAGNIRVDILEPADIDCWRSYYLDEEFRVWKVAPSDIFWSRRLKYVEGGRVPFMELESFNEREHGRVLYWTPDGWVSEAQLQAQHN